ncbi:hypothetical protein BDF20DRAFT_820958 [Mycotypha africana]|uniref:uncharacterized protein n=1 Tax=Mycotypha africana TaxID=64632 RepID=UPI0023019051|nr:uncharacterized protein BDF20DRAFT_820958 [Mycotypha africana]KAI8977642.1 hypothetical protein BDF20DRAFT_820958 [Mycotypha africana]
MPASLTSKISRMRSVKLPFNRKRSDSPPPPMTSSKETTTYYSQEMNTESNIFNTPEPTLIYTMDSQLPKSSFLEALNSVSKQAIRTQFDDVFDSFFFNDKRCQLRALFMTARLKQNLDSTTMASSHHPSSSLDPNLLHQPPQRSSSQQHKSVDRFWRTVCHRLYTLNYILFVLPADSETRNQFLRKMESGLAQQQQGKELLQQRGGMEAHFSVRYALDHCRRRRRKTLLEDAFEAEKRNGGNVEGAILPTTSTLSAEEMRKHNHIVENARYIIEQCLDSEARLGHQERDAMYVLHSMRAGLLDAFDIHIELVEDRTLRQRLKRLVEKNKASSNAASSSPLPMTSKGTTTSYDTIPPPCKNPFEDEDLIVTEEDESSLEEGKFFEDIVYKSKKKEVVAGPMMQ